jgi:phage terminase large subunit GpA-like protein
LLSLSEAAASRAGRILYGALARSARPIDELTVSQYADRYRKVSAESGSPWKGDWRTDRMPHLREPMDCLHPDHPSKLVVLKWAAQLGKTEIGVNWFAFIVDRAPGTVLTLLPSLDEMLKYNRVKLQPTIDVSPELRLRVRKENQRDEASSTSSFKRFAGGWNQITTASSSKGLQMISVRYLIAEEITGYPFDTDNRGDPLEQAKARQKAYTGNLKRLFSSTPGHKATCRISALFDAGDRRRRYVPCPDCGTFQLLTPAAMQPPSEATNWLASFNCLSCGFIMEEHHRDEMFARGEWISTRPIPSDDPEAEPVPVTEAIQPAHMDRYRCPPMEGRCREYEPSYALWTAYSPVESWQSLWEAWEEAKKSQVTLKTFTQQSLGEPWEDGASEVQHEKLHRAREEIAPGLATADHPIWTGFIDCQGDRLVWSIWAWGPMTQGVLMARGIIPHAPETPEAVAGIDELLSRTWPAATGGIVEVVRWGIDGSNWSNWVRSVGSGRGHKLWVCEGAEKRNAPILGTPKRLAIKDKFGRVLAKALVYPTGVFELKHTIMRGLRQFVAGPMESGAYLPGTLRLPRDLVDESFCKQITAEVCIDPAQEAKGNARRKLHEKPGDNRVWVKRAGQANEELDIVVGCRAIAWSLGVDTMNAAGWAKWRERLAPPEAVADLFSAAPLAAAAKPAPEGMFARLAALNNQE